MVAPTVHCLRSARFPPAGGISSCAPAPPTPPAHPPLDPTPRRLCRRLLKWTQSLRSRDWFLFVVHRRNPLRGYSRRRRNLTADIPDLRSGDTAASSEQPAIAYSALRKSLLALLILVKQHQRKTSASLPAVTAFALWHCPLVFCDLVPGWGRAPVHCSAERSAALNGRFGFRLGTKTSGPVRSLGLAGPRGLARLALGSQAGFATG